jgi:hypothetical protein
MKKVDKDKETLSQEDYQMVGRIILGWSLVYRLITKMTPEQYADKLLKGTKSKRKLATVRLMFDAIREEADPLVTPQEFNEKLTKEMLDKSVNDLRDLTVLSEEGVQLSQYLSSPDINFVLDTLEDIGILDNIIGKEAIKHELNRMPGRLKTKRDTDDTFGERFCGRPSAYKKSETMNKLSNLLHSKSQARDLVYNTLKDSNILFNYEAFVLSALYLALRKGGPIDISKNDSLAQKILRATGSDRVVDETKIEALREELLKLNPDQIKQFAAERAKIAVESRKDDASFLLGLFHM